MNALGGYNQLDYRIHNALTNIFSQYGHRASIDERARNTVQIGRNSAVATAATGSTLMTFQTGVNYETYATGNTIDRISSSSASDTEIVTVEGHTVSGGNLTYVSQTVTLNGQNKVVLSTPLYRVHKAYNADSTPLVGAIYVYEDTAISAGVPTDTTKTHCIIPAASQQSFKGALSVASDEYLILTSMVFTCIGGSASNGDGAIEVREAGKQFITQLILSAGSGNSHIEYLDPAIVIKPNSDVRAIAVRTGTGVTLSVTLYGYLAKIVQ